MTHQYSLYQCLRKNQPNKKFSFQALHTGAIMELEVISVTTRRIETPPIMGLSFTTHLIQVSWKNRVRRSICYVMALFHVVDSAACATWWPHWSTFCDDWVSFVRLCLVFNLFLIHWNGPFLVFCMCELFWSHWRQTVKKQSIGFIA